MMKVIGSWCSLASTATGANIELPSPEYSTTYGSYWQADADGFRHAQPMPPEASA